MPLSRESLKTLLCSTTWRATQADVCRAVAKWASESKWVKSSVIDGKLTAEHLVDITHLLQPWAMAANEFKELAHIFTVKVQREARILRHWR